MYHPDLHHRRSIRLPDYDYSQQGLYFVTICVQDRECLFGDIDKEEMRLNEIGKIVRNEWLKTAELRPNVKLHEFVVMPNHFHAILEITEKINGNYVLPENAGNAAFVGAGRALPLPQQPNQRTNELPNTRFQNIGKNTLSSIIGSFKSAVTRNIHILGYDFSWQRNLWEHIIRDTNDHARIAEYINNNPANWDIDRFYKK
ncbi:hypothetical protein FACS1894182_05260 [Bacteroidia bacterium]|nr:hypothetical protein FACS1894182_05260 [Bacteroidia bacterium]